MDYFVSLAYKWWAWVFLFTGCTYLTNNSTYVVNTSSIKRSDPITSGSFACIASKPWPWMDFVLFMGFVSPGPRILCLAHHRHSNICSTNDKSRETGAGGGERMVMLKPWNSSIFELQRTLQIFWVIISTSLMTKPVSEIHVTKERGFLNDFTVDQACYCTLNCKNQVPAFYRKLPATCHINWQAESQTMSLCCVPRTPIPIIHADLT